MFLDAFAWGTKEDVHNLTDTAKKIRVSNIVLRRNTLSDYSYFVRYNCHPGNIPSHHYLYYEYYKQYMILRGNTLPGCYPYCAPYILWSLLCGGFALRLPLQHHNKARENLLSSCYNYWRPS